MRFFLLLLMAAFSPLLGLAQTEFVPGTYVLADGTQGTGMLRYENGPKATLLVKDPKADPKSKAGKKGQEFAAAKVRSFALAGDHYVMLHSTRLDSGMPFSSTTMKDNFAKVLLEGKLELLEYDLTQMVRSGMSRDNAGNRNAPMQAAYTKAYLLRRQGEDEAASIPVIGKKYREVLTSYLAGRPDLIKKVGPKPTTQEDLFELVKAYNAGQ